MDEYAALAIAVLVVGLYIRLGLRIWKLEEAVNVRLAMLESGGNRNLGARKVRVVTASEIWHTRPLGNSNTLDHRGANCGPPCPFWPESSPPEASPHP